MRKVELLSFNRSYYDLSSGDLSEEVLYTINGINVYSAEKFLIDVENSKEKFLIVIKRSFELE